MTDTASTSGIAVEPEVTSRRKALITRLSVWLLFGVILGLLPLIASVIKGAMSPDGLSFTQVLGGGELFIVSAVIAAGAMGELFAGPSRRDRFCSRYSRASGLSLPSRRTPWPIWPFPLRRRRPWCTCPWFSSRSRCSRAASRSERRPRNERYGGGYRDYGFQCDRSCHHCAQRVVSVVRNTAIPTQSEDHELGRSGGILRRSQGERRGIGRIDREYPCSAASTRGGFRCPYG